jgi:hypothetical protein
LLAHGRWFSPGTPTSSTTETGRHDLAEILLKMALSTKIKKIKSFRQPILAIPFRPFGFIAPKRFFLNLGFEHTR